mmetsp:Transcript_13303/g.42430  ORF Transcript_13303/g.42430 Transcript_13303/m.42430 type:complete len:207 (+) Transcript_13303:328-948(+)
MGSNTLPVDIDQAQWLLRDASAVEALVGAAGRVDRHHPHRQGLSGGPHRPLSLPSGGCSGVALPPLRRAHARGARVRHGGLPRGVQRHPVLDLGHLPQAPQAGPLARVPARRGAVVPCAHALRRGLRLGAMLRFLQRGGTRRHTVGVHTGVAGRAGGAGAGVAARFGGRGGRASRLRGARGTARRLRLFRPSIGRRGSRRAPRRWP